MSLRARIAIVTFCLLVLVIAAVLTFSLGEYRRGALSLIERSELSSLDTLAVFAEETLLTRNFASFQPFFEALLSSPDIAGAMLADERGQIVASSDPRRVGTQVGDLLHSPGARWRWRTVGEIAAPGGTLGVEFSSARRERLDRAVRVHAAGAGFAGALLCVAVSLLAAHLLARRLKRLVETAREVTGGNLAARTRTTSRDEVGELGRAFDQMVEKLTLTQDALREHQAHLETIVEQRTAALHAAQSKLLEQERLSTLGEMTATVSHELRNPLGTISASLYAMRIDAGKLRPKQERALSRAERNISRCVRIIDDLKDYSSASELQVARFELDSLVASAFESPELESGAALELQVVPGLWITADRDLLCKALTHLLRNACQAAPDDATPDPRVQIRVWGADGCGVIEISDHGPGIPLDDLENVFRPLYSTRGFGTGLGLPVARRIVERHGGSLVIDSAPGQGTTATVRLPLSEAPPPVAEPSADGVSPILGDDVSGQERA